MESIERSAILESWNPSGRNGSEKWILLVPGTVQLAMPKNESRKQRLQHQQALACDIWYRHCDREKRIVAWRNATGLKQSNFYARIADAKTSGLFARKNAEQLRSKSGVPVAPPPIPKKMPALLSSKEENWATPLDLFNEWNDKFHFDLDVCADATNHKCDKYFDIAADGLKQRWAPKTCWMNPPYGKSIGHWMAKAHTESLHGATVVCLVNYRPTTQWYKTWATKGEIHRLEKRIKFIHPRTREAKTASPHHSVIVVFRPVGDEGG